MPPHQRDTARASSLARLRAWARSKPLGWRLSVPVAFACAGLLATTSMINARGTDLRGGRHGDLIGIVSDQRNRVEDLQAEVRTLEERVEFLTDEVGGAKVDRVLRQVEELSVDAGMEALAGPGLVVTLDDPPLDQEVPEGVDPNLLVVHQQDLQAVVNALWAGGAEGVSLQGQRIISTTGIKCVGNTVLLQGVPYSPPYRIVAVGHPARMYAALLASPEVQGYRTYVGPPTNLGWSLRESSLLRVPAYDGAVGLEYARPAG